MNPAKIAEDDQLRKHLADIETIVREEFDQAQRMMLHRRGTTAWELGRFIAMDGALVGRERARAWLIYLERNATR